MDLNKLEESARKAGGDQWYVHPNGPGTGKLHDTHVWGGDGDGVARCFGNIGHMPEAVDGVDVAAYIAAANPAAILEMCALIRKQEQALTDSNASLMEQTELAVRCRQQAETMEAENTRLVAQMATMQHKPQPTPGVGPCAGLNCGATDGVSHSVECAAEHAAVIAGGRFVPKGAAPTVKQLTAQLGSDEKWTIAEQKAFAPFLAQFPNESSQGILSLGSAWKHGQAYGMTLALEPEFAKAMADLDAAMAMSFKVDDADAAPQQQAQAAGPIEVDGLGSITNEEDGVLTLRFKDDDAAQAFFRSHQPTVDCRDMPRPTIREHAQAALIQALNDIAAACNCCGDRSDLSQIAADALEAQGIEISLSKADQFDAMNHRLKNEFDPVDTAGNAQAARSDVNRCEHCDGSGLVHRPDGTFLGTCGCIASQQPAAAPAPCKLGGGCSCITEEGGISESCKYYAAPAIQQEGAELDERAAFEAHIQHRSPGVDLSPHPGNPQWYGVSWVHEARLAWVKARAALAAPNSSSNISNNWREAIDGLTDFAPTNRGPLPGMTRGGAYVLKANVIDALSAIAPLQPQSAALDDAAPPFGNTDTAYRKGYQQGRAAGIEEAAKLIDKESGWGRLGTQIRYQSDAAAIRALAAKPAEDGK